MPAGTVAMVLLAAASYAMLTTVLAVPALITVAHVLANQHRWATARRSAPR